MLRLLSLLVLLLLTPLVQAGDWPQWLGPNRDGSSPETIAPWQGTPRILWKQPVGEGNSSPVVAAGKVFIHSKVKDKLEEEVIAYDARSGKEEWHYVYERAPFTSLYGNGPRATPAVVDGKVYTFGITGVLTCLDLAGKKVWQVDTLAQFKGKNLLFGLACSPLVDKDHVLVNVGAEWASIVAFDRNTGVVAWKSLSDKASYSSPIAFDQGGQRQVAFLTGAGLVSLNPTDGKPFWQFPLVDKLFESSTTPVKVGNRIVASSITYGSACLNLETKDGKPAYAEAWKNPELTCYFSTPMAVGTEQLYLVTGKNPLQFKNPEATLRCIDMATGKELWSKQNVGRYHAALLRTGDGKLLLHDDNGGLALVQPDAKEYRELCRSKIGGATWAHPALANGLLYIRNEREVICLQVGQ